MNSSPATTPPRGGRPRDPWALGFVVILLVLSPALLSARALHERSQVRDAPDGPVLRIVDELLGGVQKTTICVVAVLAGLAISKADVFALVALSVKPSGHVNRGRIGGGLLAGVRRARQHRHARAVLEPGRLDHDAHVARGDAVRLLDAVPGIRTRL